jgi:nucleotide-binding universal stress UspA family protein
MGRLRRRRAPEAEAATLQAAHGISTAFRCVVLALNGSPTDELVVRRGCELAKPVKARVVALHVIEVDWSHDLTDEVEDGKEQASAILDHAEAIAEKHHVELESMLLQARDVGAALVDEAVEMDADVIIVGLPYRKRFGGDFAIGMTVPYVLQNAPAEVVVIRESIASSTARGPEPAARWKPQE